MFSLQPSVSAAPRIMQDSRTVFIHFDTREREQLSGNQGSGCRVVSSRAPRNHMYVTTCTHVVSIAESLPRSLNGGELCCLVLLGGGGGGATSPAIGGVTINDEVELFSYRIG